MKRLLYSGSALCVFLLVMANIASASICQNDTNLVLGKSVTVAVVNNDAALAYEGESSSDITDGSLVYIDPSQRQEDGCVGWKNSVSGRTMTVVVDIDLGVACNITAIRYNKGNTPSAGMAADTITTSLGTTSINTGTSGAWTTQYAAAAVESSTVTITLTKTNTGADSDWMFIGEIEVYGSVVTTPVEEPPTSVLLNVPFLEQFYSLNGSSCGNGSCGPASLSMCACYVLGRSATYLDIVNVWSFLGRDTCGNDSSGTSLTELANAARGWPFGLSNVYRSTLTLQGVKDELAAGRPVVVHVQAGYLTTRKYTYTGGHYIAAIGYDEDHIICNDPGTMNGERCNYSNEDMTAAMAYKGNGVLRGFYQ
ncbi:C39 family peptidase [bacterium]|nr:C39 family peptidase [bacterium]